MIYRVEVPLTGQRAMVTADAGLDQLDLWDAVFVPSEVVRKAAAAVAEREGLRRTGSTTRKGFLPGPDPDAQRFYSSDSLIVLLYRQLGFTTVDQGLDLVQQAYPGRSIPAKVRFLLTEIVDSIQD